MSRARRLIWMAAGCALVITGCTSTEPVGTVGTTGDEDIRPTGDQPATGLPDGETFAWVRGLAGDGFLIDPADLLSGEEARQAAVEAGVIAEGEDLPNDFFISDPSDETWPVSPSKDATYALLLFEGGSPTETEVSHEEFTATLEGNHPDVYGVVEGELPAMVTVAGGEVTEIVQVYLP